MLIHQKCQFKFGAYSVCSAYEDRMRHIGDIEFKKTSEAADVQGVPFKHGAGYVLLHEFNSLVSGGDIHAAGCITFRS